MTPPPDADDLVAKWGADPGTLTHVRDGANAVYEFRARGARQFLRLSPDRHRSATQLEAELDFVRFVTSKGVAAASPVPSDRGQWVETAQGRDAQLWHAVVFTAAPGRHFRYFSDDIDRPLFYAWGIAMGTLHAASRQFVPVPSRQRRSWRDQDTTSCDGTRIPAAETEARLEYERVMAWLESQHTPPGSWGLIHGDFERTNFAIEGSTVTVYDFDDACYHWYLADVAHALWAFRGAPSSDRGRFLRWFLDGYQERSPVDTDAREQLSWFVRLRSLSLFLHCLLAADRSAPEGEWEQRMRAGFVEPFSW